MPREERESARAEREAASAAKRAERQAWVAEHRWLMDKVVELRVQLALSGRHSQFAAQGSPAVEGGIWGPSGWMTPPGDSPGLGLLDPVVSSVDPT